MERGMRCHALKGEGSTACGDSCETSYHRGRAALSAPRKSREMIWGFSPRDPVSGTHAIFKSWHI